MQEVTGPGKASVHSIGKKGSTHAMTTENSPAEEIDPELVDRIKRAKAYAMKHDINLKGKFGAEVLRSMIRSPYGIPTASEKDSTTKEPKS